MISIVIIHYHGQQLIEQAIQTIVQHTNQTVLIEFLIIDNSYNLDKTFLENLAVNYIYHSPGYNSGFARGMNWGIRNATGETILLLNQDAFFIAPNTLSSLLGKLNTLPPKTILSCSIEDENGNFQESVWIDDPDIAREWRFGPINCKLNPDWQQEFEAKKKAAHAQSGYVHRINGAFIMFKNGLHKIEALFDEDFFVYGEDIEWALRLKKKGWRFYFEKEVSIKHIGSASSSDTTIKQMQIILSDWVVIKKTKGSIYLLLLLLQIFFNKSLDLFLLKLAEWRGKIKNKEIGMAAKKNSSLHFYLIKNYGAMVLFQNKFSSEKDFDINCYKNDERFVKQDIKTY